MNLPARSGTSESGYTFNMEQLKARVARLKSELDAAIARLDLGKQKTELSGLRVDMAKSDFWADNKKALDISKREADLARRIEPWLRLQDGLNELEELIGLSDAGMSSELKSQAGKLEAAFLNLKKQLKFRGRFDERDVILSIYAGAGGTDAQDWAQILLRMYVRWADAHGLKTKTVEQTAGEKAGLKSVTVELTDGSFLYGKLAGEHGVHRLVRLSPFNADNLRQTSFAKVEILPIIDKPEEVALDDKDLKIDVFHSGGAGGQSVNTTDSAVRVTHLPTGIAVAIQNERSQLQNKETALTVLRSRLAALQLAQHAKNIAELKGPNQSAEWGNQIRSYVLHPYKMVKDLRTNHETSDAAKVLDGDLDPFIDAWLEHNISA